MVTNYSIMGVAKAALESAVRYMAAELGPKGIRVLAISLGPLATRAAEFDELLAKAERRSPARELVGIDDVGVATAFLAHDAARLWRGSYRAESFFCRQLQRERPLAMHYLPAMVSSDLALDFRIDVGLFPLPKCPI